MVVKKNINGNIFRLIDSALEFCPWVEKSVNNHAINKYRYSNQKHMQSQIKKQCTLLLLTNLAEPEWVPIKCSDRIIGDIMCMVPINRNITTYISPKADLIVFKNNCVFITGKCYLFSWGFLNDSSMSKFKMRKSTLVAMEYLVTKTNAKFPPFHSFFNLIMYCKISRKWILQNITEPHKGIHTLMLPHSKYIRYGNVFECGKDIFIAYAYICDGKKDCPCDIAYDESACICGPSLVSSRKCKYIVSKEGIKKYSIFFLTLKDGTCLYYGLGKVNSKLVANDHEFTCTSNNAITLMAKNNLVTDCSSNRDDGKHMVFKYNSNSICQEIGQLSCEGGHKKCYRIAEICTYRLNENNLLIPCRNGEHVANCRMIQCNMKFKCPGFYCIPSGCL